MTLNTLADLFGPYYLAAAKYGVVFCLGAFAYWFIQWVRVEIQVWKFKRRLKRIQAEREEAEKQGNVRPWDTRYRRPDFINREVGENRTTASGRVSQGPRPMWH